MNFSQYSGYVTVNHQASKALFYWLTESQNNPTQDPLVLWLNGGNNLSIPGSELDRIMFYVIVTHLHLLPPVGAWLLPRQKMEHDGAWTIQGQPLREDSLAQQTGLEHW